MKMKPGTMDVGGWDGVRICIYVEDEACDYDDVWETSYFNTIHLTVDTYNDGSDAVYIEEDTDER